MSTVLCNKMPNCVRVLGHLGCCTACPSAATLDWDRERTPLAFADLEALASLWALDSYLETPPWADLNDPE